MKSAYFKYKLKDVATKSGYIVDVTDSSGDDIENGHTINDHSYVNFTIPDNANKYTIMRSNGSIILKENGIDVTSNYAFIDLEIITKYTYLAEKENLLNYE